MLDRAFQKKDGATKDDCERHLAKRLLTDVRREHLHLKLIVIEDALASNRPHIRHLKELNLRFILGAKASDHRYLFDWIDMSKQTQHYEYTDQAGSYHRFCFLNGAPLNDANYNLEINFIEYWETSTSGKTQHFSWVTDLWLSYSIRFNNAAAICSNAR